MAATLVHEQGNRYRLDIHGTLRQADLDRSQQVLSDEIRRVGKVRLLVMLDNFDGWDRRDTWNDLTFYVRYGPQIERIAIVGPERWRHEMLLFANADLREGLVEFFPSEQIEAARRWLAGWA
jgi:SpoIIAA-like